MTADEENQSSPEAPYGWTLDDKTGQLRPKKSPGRPRVHQVADESDPESHLATRRAPTYRWLRDNDFPSGFQVLCANCNCGKQWNRGVCPHQAMPEAPSSSQVRGPLSTES